MPLCRTGTEKKGMNPKAEAERRAYRYPFKGEGVVVGFISGCLVWRWICRRVPVEMSGTVLWAAGGAGGVWGGHKKASEAECLRGFGVVLRRFELRQAEPKSDVLPLHHRTIRLLVLSYQKCGKGMDFSGICQEKDCFFALSFAKYG